MAHLSRFDLSNIKINLELSGGLCVHPALLPSPRCHLCSCPMHHPQPHALAPSGAPGARINHPAATLKDETIACSAAGDHRGNHTACHPLRAGGGGDATLRQRFIYLILLGWDFFSSLKHPQGNCSPWNINATQDASSLKCHLAVISPVLIIPQGERAPVPPCSRWSRHTGQSCPSPLLQQERYSLTSPKNVSGPLPPPQRWAAPSPAFPAELSPRNRCCERHHQHSTNPAWLAQKMRGVTAGRGGRARGRPAASVGTGW